MDMDLEMLDGSRPVVESSRFARIRQHFIDRTTLWIKCRWASFFLALVLYAVRIWYVKAFHIVTYSLGIYLLNLTIGFLTPAIDPEETDGVPVANSEEFRPFSRKVSEFKFWLGAMRAVVTACVMTCFPVFDMPVFWPILLSFFIFLVITSGQDRIKHMIKYRYLPFTTSTKKTYQPLPRDNIDDDEEL
eukprot:TRINITY_DN73937_c0_g1_i1.p1 TRINITY_DN73937_c0_g1~~TRINITY_DN73937_c0_g1_i1.p1  ORF type:complete len:189 (+),score=29.46 TRINITY_DN73937_c0_g1_i1:125-691(+)